MPSPLQIHSNAWKNCQRCPLYRERKNVCICRGQVPAEVLFIGEAPGESEDLFGLPFYGPAGKLLDKLIAKAEQDAGVTVTKCWTNLVGCIPKTSDEQRKKVEPLPAEIASCYPRLDDFIDICNPTLIVAVGEIAQKYNKLQNWASRATVVEIVHPAYILRAPIERKGLAIQRTGITLRDAFNDLIPF